MQRDFCRRHQREPRAVEQASPNLERRRVKRDGRKLQEDFISGKARIVCVLDESHDIAMLHRDSLRPSRRTRGVHHVRQIVRGRYDRRIVATRARDFLPQFIYADRFRGVRRQILEQRHLRQQHRHARIFEHELQARLRIIRIERHICTAGFQDAKQRDDHLG